MRLFTAMMNVMMNKRGRQKPKTVIATATLKEYPEPKNALARF